MRPHGLTGVPITDANHEWQGYIPFDQLPSVYNPPGGILATANSRITPDGYATPVTLDWGPPYRNERIWKVLASKPKLAAADMLALQNDVYSPAGPGTGAAIYLRHRSCGASEPQIAPGGEPNAHLGRERDDSVGGGNDCGRDPRCVMANDFEAAIGSRLEAVSVASSSFVQEQIVTGAIAALGCRASTATGMNFLAAAWTVECRPCMRRWICKPGITGKRIQWKVGHPAVWRHPVDAGDGPARECSRSRAMEPR